jgi:hypothetical protein
VSPGYGHDERDDCGHACDFKRATIASADSLDSLTRSLITFNETTATSTETFTELTARLADLMKKSKKGGLSERQIQKTIRMRGKR